MIQAHAVAVAANVVRFMTQYVALGDISPSKYPHGTVRLEYVEFALVVHLPCAIPFAGNTAGPIPARAGFLDSGQEMPAVPLYRE